ncbi:DUF3466 family protein [Bowmanella dokdonensis]|uniref:DUF3466 family protein n=1 Tax=Bowmanella dokdonensis TaxID=751969 RepID=A0A939ILM2_9ALTE|nr:DUF3466 family protein [Bowmanella dokdonensis]MBN7824368.1 DUF3466 family protein [Bowmanella dokdonensis]
MITTRLLPLSTLSLSLFVSGLTAATYQVVELGSKDEGVYSYANAISEQGQVAVTVQSPFNPVIDLELLNLEENETLQGLLDDPEAVMNGNISSTDLAIIYNYLKSDSLRNNPLFQKIGNYEGHLADSQGSDPVVAFDVVEPSLGELTGSTDLYLFDVNANGISVGSASAPYRKIDYVNEAEDNITFVVRDFSRRGFVKLDNQVVELEPTDSSLGGRSDARAISDNLLVAGFMTIEAGTTVEDAVERCEDEEIRGDIPEEVCKNNAVTNLTGNASLDSFYKSRAAIWALDSEGNILETRTFGLLFEPASDDTNLYGSYALDINDQGVAVGQASHRYRDTDSVTSFAAVFHGEDQVSGFIDDQEYIGSTALGINNHNQVVGHATKTINGYRRSKFYVYDFDEQSLTFPADFFPGSASVARAINDNGLVVGEGEVETVIGNSVRRRHAFIYDHNEQSFQDLNDLVACNSPYTLVQGNDINNAGEIAATAVVTRARLDITGEPILDEAGNQIMEDAVVAVKLVPVPGGEIDNCELEEPKTERQGAGLGWFMLALLGFAGIRRKN